MTPWLSSRNLPRLARRPTFRLVTQAAVGMGLPPQARPKYRPHSRFGLVGQRVRQVGVEPSRTNVANMFKPARTCSKQSR